MDALIGALLVSPFVAVGLLWLLVSLGLGQRAAAARERLWREAAAAAGLERIESTERGLEGWSGALRVRLARFAHGQVHGTRITVDRGLPEELSVTPESFDTRLQSLRGVREIELGDEEFDEAAWVQGSPAEVRAVLDTEARSMLCGLLRGRLPRPRLAALWATGRIEKGRLTVEVPEVSPARTGDASNAFPGRDPIADAAADAAVAGGSLFPVALQQVVALAHRLARPQDAAAQLAAHLKAEPEFRVRLRGLQTLVREFPRHPATREALLGACDDPFSETRLEAALALGPEKRHVLLQLAHGEGAEDDVTARAVAALGDSLTIDETDSVLRDALRTRRLGTARACLGVLGQRKGGDAVAMLARVLAVETAELAVAAARALADTCDPAAAEPLLAALDHHDADVRLAAVRALGRVGTVGAVARLKQAEAGERALRAAARQAVAEIQSRLSDAAPGQLSLAGAESGQLSLPDDRQGRLSLPTGEHEGRPTRRGDEDSGRITGVATIPAGGKE